MPFTNKCMLAQCSSMLRVLFNLLTNAWCSHHRHRRRLCSSKTLEASWIESAREQRHDTAFGSNQQRWRRQMDELDRALIQNHNSAAHSISILCVSALNFHAKFTATTADCRPAKKKWFHIHPEEIDRVEWSFLTLQQQQIQLRRSAIFLISFFSYNFNSLFFYLEKCERKKYWIAES